MIILWRLASFLKNARGMIELLAFAFGEGRILAAFLRALQQTVGACPLMDAHQTLDSSGPHQHLQTCADRGARPMVLLQDHEIIPQAAYKERCL